MAASAESPDEPRSQLTVIVELRERDIVRAHFWTLFRLPLVRLLVGLNGLLLLFVLLGAVRAFLRARGSPGVAIGLFVVVLFFGLFPFQVRRRAQEHFRSLSEEQRRGTYTFHEDRFEWTLGPAPGMMPWQAVKKVAETGDYLFLMTPAWRTHVIPKRCLRPGDIEILMAHLLSNGSP